MTKKHKRILIIYLLIILVGTTIPFLFCWVERLKWSLDIARTISILSASILAILFFDPFGIRKSNLAKQHDNVIQILEKSFVQRICVDTKSSTPERPLKIFSQHFMTTKHLNFILADEFASEYINYPVLIDLKNFIEENKELTELKNSLFTPKRISEKMTFLELSFATRSNNHYKSYSIAYWGSLQNDDNISLYDQFNNEKLTLNGILSNYRIMITECILWLESNSFSVKHLNIK